MVDLGGDALLPGLHDSHVHPFFAGLEQYQCRLPESANAAAVSAAVRACAARSRPGDWILGGNWVAGAFGEGEQTKALLDRAAPDNPVLLNDEAHHSVWVNSAALRAAGVTRSTPNPEGGIIEHDASGEPTGLLRESATRLAESVVPPPSEAQKREALILAANQMLSYGITSFTIASVRRPEIQTLADLSGEGRIKQRMRGCLVWDPGPQSLRAAEEALIDHRADYARPRFKTDCVKVFMDGVPTESHTGAMLEPYVDAGAKPHDERPPKGLLLVPQDLLNQTVARYDEAGLSVKFHAAGDAAVRAAIDAIAAAHARNGLGGPLHAVGHSTFVSSEDMGRARGVQMAWEFSPYIWYPTPIASVDIVAAVGEARMKRWVPVREAVETGVLVVGGSDWSVVPSVNPWLGMETMVTRQKPGGSADTLGKDEAVSLDQAFRIFTLNGARLMRQDDLVGDIEVGKHADVIITAGDPFAQPITRLHETRVKKAYIDGELVFDADHPPVLTAGR
jgi:predicted amidohydrolase YtcJ